MKKHSILIIEDEVVFNQFLQEYMEIYFEKVYSAFDGEEGLELYNKYRPDIIITDIHMPKIDGLDLIAKIRQTDTTTKIIVLSAHTDKEKLFKAIELQLVTYLVKPIKSDELKAIILNIQKLIQNSNIISISKDCSFNLLTKELFVENKNVPLTLNEQNFLVLLLQKPNVCISYNEIHNIVFELNEYSKNSMASLVKRLRKKVYKDIIVSCYDIGYKIVIE